MLTLSWGSLGCSPMQGPSRHRTHSLAFSRSSIRCNLDSGAHAAWWSDFPGIPTWDVSDSDFDSDSDSDSDPDPNRSTHASREYSRYTLHTVVHYPVPPAAALAWAPTVKFARAASFARSGESKWWWTSSNVRQVEGMVNCLRTT